MNTDRIFNEMATQSSTISIRLQPSMRANLDRATKLTRRSRSFLMQEALEKYLEAVVEDNIAPEPQHHLTRLLSFKGAGLRTGRSRTAEEIDAHIRWLRDDD